MERAKLTLSRVEWIVVALACAIAHAFYWRAALQPPAWDAKSYLEIAAEIAEHVMDAVLTPREISVLKLIAGGHANKEIAAQLHISEESVKGYVKNILFKLDANDRTHAAMIGLKRGIIDL